MIWNPDPIAFSISGITVAWYGLSWSFAIVVGYFVMQFIFKREQKDLTKLVPFIQYIFIFSLSGARLFEMIFYQFGRFVSNPLTFFYFRDGGLASHGAMLGTVVAIYLFLRKNKDFKFSWLMDRSIIAATLQGAIVRIGNFMNSELYGTVTDVPWAVSFVNVDTLNRHPVQIYEALWLFVCFTLFLLVYLYKKEIKPWFLSGLFFVVVLGGRVLLEFFKESETLFLIFSKTQVISLTGILVGIFLIRYSTKEKY